MSRGCTPCLKKVGWPAVSVRLPSVTHGEKRTHSANSYLPSPQPCYAPLSPPAPTDLPATTTLFPDLDAYTAGTRFSRFQHNVGDFLFIARAALEAAGGYSEYPGNWGIDAELVCRLSLSDGMTPLLLSRSCYILHQPHPEVYNFSRMSLEFPFVHTCLAYENGTMVRSDVARGSRGPHDFGFPAQVFEEEWVFADGSVRRCRGPQSFHC